MKDLGALIFPGFELLDLFGPLEMFGLLPDHYRLHLVAETPGAVASAQGPQAVATVGLAERDSFDLLLVPGGRGTRALVKDKGMLDRIARSCAACDHVLSVCTGSAVLAKAGVLDGRRATTNKAAFEQMMTHGPEVDWVREARWVEDGKFFTASGVSAGMDMALAVIAKLDGMEAAEQVAIWAEYEWHRDADWDPFAKVHGLI
ncbi:DJ-1/PfpI family protein [Thalassococcus sp. S3]|uniref:DJ-1/PfpI family protein n=1 Tax=Thalassococcus sp. S3 TaxID=2017482 RepID=UPI0010240FF8|nr:DJ-1/PfpI family protein [Thalassococcus sp. S3]QBF33265.1 dimethyladenosine transferase [Thalassococcus sp. S3]